MTSTIKTRLFSAVKVSLLIAMLCVAVDAMLFSSSILFGAKRILALLSLGTYLSCVGLLLLSELNKWTNHLTLDETQSRKAIADDVLNDISLWMLTGGTTLTIGYSFSDHLTSAIGAVLMRKIGVQLTDVVSSLLLTNFVAVLCMLLCMLRSNTLTVEFYVPMIGSTLVVFLVWFLGGVSQAAVASGMTLPSCGVIVLGLTVQSYGIYTLARNVFIKPDAYVTKSKLVGANCE